MSESGQRRVSGKNAFAHQEQELQMATLHAWNSGGTAQRVVNREQQLDFRRK